ncbi:unnamed protein product [Cochlearia groenlandica]
MDDDMWTVSSSGSSISYRSAIATKYQSEEEEEEDDDDDDRSADYPCPFCSDDYELVELIHHISEEHDVEANHGICPVCSKSVKMHMVDHITTHHRDLLKISFFEQKQTSYEDDPYSSDKYHQSVLDELHSSLNHHRAYKSVVSDEYLSFINNSSLPDQTKKLGKTDSIAEENRKKLIKDHWTERESKSVSPLLSDSEQLEKANKCEYVQGLLLSAMFDDKCGFL